MHRSLLNLQSYVPRIGDAVFPPPFSIDGMDMLVLVLATHREEVNALLNRELNGPWQEAFALRGLRHNYEAAADWIVVVLSEADEVYPTISARARKANGDGNGDGNGAALGVSQAGAVQDADDEPLDVSAHQRELIVMVPVLDRGANPPEVAVADSGSLWYVPLVLNDLPPAVAAGREIFGYPKVYATFDTESSSGCKAVRIQAHGPVKRTSDQIEDAKKIARDKGRDIHVSKYQLSLVDVLNLKFSSTANGPKPADADKFATEASARFGEQVELLFLRQFLDPQFDGRASYQAVVSGTVTAGAGSFNADALKAETNPQQFKLELPKSAITNQSLAQALGVRVDPGARDDVDIVTPCAVFGLRNQNLLVPRGEIKWDKS